MDGYFFTMTVLGISAILAFFLVIKPSLKAYELEQQKKAQHNG
jgi:hypothetical protein